MTRESLIAYELAPALRNLLRGSYIHRIARAAGLRLRLCLCWVIYIRRCCCDQEISIPILLNAKGGRRQALIQALVRKDSGCTRLIVVNGGDKKVDGVGVVECYLNHV